MVCVDFKSLLFTLIVVYTNSHDAYIVIYYFALSNVQKTIVRLIEMVEERKKNLSYDSQ